MTKKLFDQCVIMEIKTSAKPLTSCIIGVDEAGRGAWAGPVVVAAVAWPEAMELTGLNDSKKLTAKKRDGLRQTIRDHALSYCVISVPASVVDQINVLAATLLGMDVALSKITDPATSLSIQIDGNKTPQRWPSAQWVIQGDGSVPAIMAASVLAKTARDEWMSIQAHQAHPSMQFDRHKGYGVALHHKALKTHGVTPLHRISYKPVAAVLAEFEKRKQKSQ